MPLLARNTFKTITTSLPKTIYDLLQNRISFTINLRRYKHNSEKISKDHTSDSGSGVRKSLFAPVQQENSKKPRKVTIIGSASNVGQIIGYDLLLKRFCDEIVFYDLPTKTPVYGVVLDMLGGVSLRDHPNIKVCTNGDQTKDSDLLIICAGVGVAKGQTRLDTLKANVDIFRTLIPKFVHLSPNCVMIIISNPVDIMTYAAWKFSGFPFQRVLGTGTELETSRFKFFLSKRLGISPKSINAWVIGEHGLTCVPCWSSINVGGTRLRDMHPSFGFEDDPECWMKLEEEVKTIANVIKKFKEFTSYSVAMTTSSIAQAVLSDAKTVHAVSTCCNDVHDFKVTSFMSLPAVLGNSGVNYIVRQVLDCQEKENLVKSAAALDKALNTIDWSKT